MRKTIRNKWKSLIDSVVFRTACAIMLSITSIEHLNKYYNWTASNSKFISSIGSTMNLFQNPYFLWTLFFSSMVVSVISIFRKPKTENKQDASISKTDNDPELPHKTVTIDVIKYDCFSCSILAKVVVGENRKPDVENFLNRISIGNPYCPDCQIELDTIHASWKVEGTQTGYRCSSCRNEIKGNHSEVLNDARSRIRKLYDLRWEIYKDKIGN